MLNVILHLLELINHILVLRSFLFQPVQQPKNQDIE